MIETEVPKAVLTHEYTLKYHSPYFFFQSPYFKILILTHEIDPQPVNRVTYSLKKITNLGGGN